ncbi:MAG: icfG [Bacteroidetes bacterium]|nr:icfG [Bacteroidota bacterium]
MTHKILVVDDEPDLEVLIKQKFRKEIKDNSFQFVFAQNGVQALERLEQHEDVSVVLSDINMPEMDGLTLLQKLHEMNNPLLKSVIVSAYGDMENIRTAMNRGAFDFLTKPIDFNDLDLTVRKTMDHLEVIKIAVNARDELVAFQRDLSTAARIQQSLLPSIFPAFPKRTEFEIHAEMRAAKNVGGDFYDFYFLDEDRLAFAIGDVSGKGIPAAIYMAVCRTLLKATAHQVAHPGEVLRRVNTLLIPESEASTFVTIFFGVLNTRTGEVQYSNGGHNPPSLVRSSGDVEQLPLTDGFLLGKMEHQDYDTKKVQLQKGDTLFLYTDGVTEAMDSEMNMYEDERMISYLKRTNGSSIQELAKGSIADLRSFVGGAPQSDDITVMTLRYLGRNGS